MFGGIIYLPLFLQTVGQRARPTRGLLILPLMGGLMTSSIGSGRIISKTGRYKIFPICGTALMALGLFPAVDDERAYRPPVLVAVHGGAQLRAGADHQ